MRYNKHNIIGIDDMEMIDATPSPQSYDYALTTQVIHTTSSREPVFMDEQQDAINAGNNSAPAMIPNVSPKTGESINRSSS